MFDLETIGRDAKNVARYIRGLTTKQKNDILSVCAAALEANSDYILAENQKDMTAADPKRATFNDRLILSKERIAGMAEGIRKVSLEEIDFDHSMVVIKKTKKTPEKFPRKAGTLEKEPI